MFVAKVESVVWSDGSGYFRSWNQCISQPFYEWVWVFFPTGCCFFLFAESVHRQKKISIYFVVLWSAPHVFRIHFSVLKRSLQCWKLPFENWYSCFGLCSLQVFHSHHIVLHHLPCVGVTYRPSYRPSMFFWICFLLSCEGPCGCFNNSWQHFVGATWPPIMWFPESTILCCSFLHPFIDLVGSCLFFWSCSALGAPQFLPPELRQVMWCFLVPMFSCVFPSWLWLTIANFPPLYRHLSIYRVRSGCSSGSVRRSDLNLMSLTASFCSHVVMFSLMSFPQTCWLLACHGWFAAV